MGAKLDRNEDRNEEMLGLLIDINNLMVTVRQKLERYKELSDMTTSPLEIDLSQEADDAMRARNQQ